MKNGRINERNIGNITINSEPKIRRKKSDKAISESERSVMKDVLTNVVNSLEFDVILSNGKGHLNPDAIFSCGERFVCCMTRTEFETLINAIEKL